MPSRRAKRLSRRQHRLDSRVLEVHRSSDNIVTPPVWRVDVVEGEGKEDDERGEGKTKVETRGREEVETAPPPEVALLDEVLEDESHDTPGQVVERGSRWDGSCTAKNNRSNEVFQRRLGILLGREVDDSRDNSTDTEEDEKAGVNLSRGEDTGRS